MRWRTVTDPTVTTLAATGGATGIITGRFDADDRTDFAQYSPAEGKFWLYRSGGGVNPVIHQLPSSVIPNGTGTSAAGRSGAVVLRDAARMQPVWCGPHFCIYKRRKVLQVWEENDGIWHTFWNPSVSGSEAEYTACQWQPTAPVSALPAEVRAGPRRERGGPRRLPVAVWLRRPDLHPRPHPEPPRVLRELVRGGRLLPLGRQAPLRGQGVPIRSRDQHAGGKRVDAGVHRRGQGRFPYGDELRELACWNSEARMAVRDKLMPAPEGYRPDINHYVPVGSMPECRGTEPPYDQIFDLVGGVSEREGFCDSSRGYDRCTARMAYVDCTVMATSSPSDTQYMGIRCCADP